jgi:hypothetical protein
LKALQQIIGVVLFDWYKYELFLRGGMMDYMKLSNRHEKLGDSPNGTGYVCLWPFTSKLHAPLVWPHLGERLLKKAIRGSSFIGINQRANDRTIDISVIIGHRGMERLPLLLCTLKYIAGQHDVGIECIVIEQDSNPRIKEYLPEWVDYYFQGSAGGIGDYNRSAAFNYGANMAKGKVMLLHDNDMLVPSTYCKDIVKIIDQGYDVVNPKRFVYYLSKSHTERILSSNGSLSVDKPDYIVENLEAGGSVAITKSGFIQIGGMDKAFIGWGGEDNEFWWRCASLKRWIWGFSSVIHLWHNSQPLKGVNENKNVEMAKNIVTNNRGQRIRELRELNFVDFRHE